MSHPVWVDDEVRAVLDEVRAGRLSLRAAAKRLGVSFSWVRYQVDPAQRARKLARDRSVDQAEAYARLTHFQRNRKLLSSRRHDAMKRMAKRNGRGSVG